MIKNKVYSDIKICDLKELYNTISIVKVYIDDKVVWDDSDYGNTKPIENAQSDFESILNMDNVISIIHLQVVHFHHFVLYIETINSKVRDK